MKPWNVFEMKKTTIYKILLIKNYSKKTFTIIEPTNNY
jgi:hypothetical protein